MQNNLAEKEELEVVEVDEEQAEVAVEQSEAEEAPAEAEAHGSGGGDGGLGFHPLKRGFQVVSGLPAVPKSKRGECPHAAPGPVGAAVQVRGDCMVAFLREAPADPSDVVIQPKDFVKDEDPRRLFGLGSKPLGRQGPMPRGDVDPHRGYRAPDFRGDNRVLAGDQPADHGDGLALRFGDHRVQPHGRRRPAASRAA